MHVASELLSFVEDGDEAPAIIKSLVCTCNQSWTSVCFTLLLFFLPAQASGAGGESHEAPYRLTCSNNVCAFGGRPWHFSGAYSQLFVGDEKTNISGPIHELFFFSYFSFFVLFMKLLFLRTARSEGTNQAPIATTVLSIKCNDSMAACNRASTEQLSTLTLVRSCRPDSRVCDNASQQTSFAASHTFFYLWYLVLFLFITFTLQLNSE